MMKEKIQTAIFRAAFLTIFFFASLILHAQSSEEIEVGIDEQLGKMLALDSKFYNEAGEEVKVADLVDKPTIFLFVYFDCPGLCNPLMAEVAALIDKVDLIPGKDYQLISVSIDERDDFEDAASKKANYLAAIKKKFPADAWRFLTGEVDQIKKITGSAGFKFKKEGEEIVHAGALIITSKEGKITRYLMGTTFLPFDIKMALLEATEGKVTPTVAKILKFCFRYDPQGRQYVLNITSIAGAGIILMAIVFVIIISIKPGRKNKVTKES